MDTMSFADLINFMKRIGRSSYRMLLFVIIILSFFLLARKLLSFNSPRTNDSGGYEYIDKEKIDFNSFEAIYDQSHSSDLSFMQSASTLFNYTDDYIPLINVFNRMGTKFMERFVRSIDFPTETLLIVQDSLDDTRLISLVRSLRRDPQIRRYIKNIRHVVNMNNTGCAQAWNTVVRLYPGEPFYIYSANDILLPSGGLQRFYLKVKQLQITSTDLGLISTETSYGIRKRGWKREVVLKKHFNAMFWAYTRQGILRAGLYDENFYPGYYEDDEIEYRNFVCGMKSTYIPEIVVTHGYPTGYYQTGTKLEDHKNIFVSEVKRSTNRKYMEKKWGPALDNGLRNKAKEMVDAGYDVFQKYCGRNDSDVPSSFRGFYCSPFNKSKYKVAEWPFHPNLRRCIQEGEGENDCEKYLEDF